MIKRILYFVIACMLISMLPVAAAASDVIEDGYCGDKVTWKFDADGVLTFSGKGNMDDIGFLYGQPWYPYRDDIKKIVIEDGVTAIGSIAFAYCRNVESVDIPESVTSIGDEAFLYCENLTQIDLHDGITWIGENAFGNCSALKSLVIPKGVTQIPFGMLSNCSGLTSVIMHEHIIGIGSSAFYNCSGLTELRVPESVTYIGDFAFYGCERLKCLVVPYGVERISDATFTHCSAMTGLWLPETVTYIASNVFTYSYGIVIHGESGSYAETFAKQEGIPFSSKHTNSYKGKQAATCGEEGYDLYICNVCGLEDHRNVQPATQDHSWGPWVETAAPNAAQDGTQTRKCGVCGEKQTGSIDNNPFADVSADRFEDAILWAYYNGITTGTGDGTTFSPEKACTRKQIVTFLWRAAGQPEPESTVNPFVDVSSDRFEKAILWAYYEGITTGTGDGTTFSPEATCTRKQIVTFLWRYNGKPASESKVNPFTDVPADRFEDAILWAYYNGVTTGTGDGSTFSPESPCTRKQIVTFLYRDLEQ